MLWRSALWGVRIASLLAFGVGLTHGAGLFLQAQASDAVRFGVVPQRPPLVLTREWAPFLSDVGAACGRRIVLSTRRTIAEFEQELLSGRYDLSFANPLQVVKATRSAEYKPIARLKKSLQGILVVRKSDTLEGINALAGQRIAYPSPNAFGASILVQAELRTKGIGTEISYVGSHDSVFEHVVRGAARAGGGVMRTYQAFETRMPDTLRILHRTPRYSAHGIVAHRRLDPGFALCVQAAVTSGAFNAPTYVGEFLPGALGDWQSVSDLFPPEPALQPGKAKE